MPLSVYSVLTTGGVVASSSGSNYQFGLRPRVVQIDNLGTVDLWAKFDTTSSGSTGDLYLGACGDLRRLRLEAGWPPWQTHVLNVTKVTIFATSTSASQVAVTAWA